MTTTALPMPTLRRDRAAVADAYGNARLPTSAHDTTPERVDKIPYGRFRNVYLYITEACQLRCEHCYMGERLERVPRQAKRRFLLPRQEQAFDCPLLIDCWRTHAPRRFSTRGMSLVYRDFAPAERRAG